MHLDLPNKLYYTIGEVAKAFDVNTSLIRFWEKEFDIIQPKKNEGGNRYFTKTDLENLQTIYHLVKERGYTLDGAKIALEKDHLLVKEIEVIARLESLRAELIKLKNEFDQEDS